MLRPGSPIITSITGSFGQATLRTSPAGKLIIRPRVRKPGPACQSEAWLWNSQSVKLLDQAARGMSYDDKQEWGICPTKVRGKALSWLGEFYMINLRRMMYQMWGILSPPDKFRSHKKYLPREDAYPIHSNPGDIGVWTDGVRKDDEPFGPGYEEGDIGPPIWPPEPPPPPPPLRPCPLGTTCNRRWNFGMRTYPWTWTCMCEYERYEIITMHKKPNCVWFGACPYPFPVFYGSIHCLPADTPGLFWNPWPGYDRWELMIWCWHGEHHAAYAKRSRQDQGPMGIYIWFHDDGFVEPPKLVEVFAL